MPEIDRLDVDTGWIDFDFIERERTPETAIRVGIQLHPAGLSLSNTKQYLETLGVERSRTAIHDWVQKADLQPVSDANPDHIALDETVIQVNDQRHWLYAAVDPETNQFLHVRLFQTRTTNSPCCSCMNFARNSRSRRRHFSSITPITSQLRWSDSGSDFRWSVMEIGTPSNVSSVR